MSHCYIGLTASVTLLDQWTQHLLLHHYNMYNKAFAACYSDELFLWHLIPVLGFKNTNTFLEWQAMLYSRTRTSLESDLPHWSDALALHIKAIFAFKWVLTNTLLAFTSRHRIMFRSQLYTNEFIFAPRNRQSL